MFFGRKFANILDVIGFNEEEVLNKSEALKEKNALTQMKKSVKRMHRESKMDAQYRGRQKIQMLFARRGIYLNI
ncbi:MAG: hypothetical protein HRT86_11525 [Ilumatobacteraceae bacterium]|nr:hypothetical protein [Ilumatobacteraceae bacterium]